MGIPTCENSGGWGGIRIPGTRIFSPLGGFPFKIPYPLNNRHLATFDLRFGWLPLSLAVGYDSSTIWN